MPCLGPALVHSSPRCGQCPAEDRNSPPRHSHVPEAPGTGDLGNSELEGPFGGSWAAFLFFSKGNSRTKGWECLARVSTRTQASGPAGQAVSPDGGGDSVLPEQGRPQSLMGRGATTRTACCRVPLVGPELPPHRSSLSPSPSSQA